MMTPLLSPRAPATHRYNNLSVAAVVLLLLSATSVSAHPQSVPQQPADANRPTNGAWGLLNYMIHRDYHQTQHQHQQRDPRLLPYHGRPRPEDGGDDDGRDDILNTAEIVKHDIAMNPSSSILPDGVAQPSTQLEELINVTPKPQPSAAPDSNESADQPSGSQGQDRGIKLLRPLRVFWDGGDDDVEDKSDGGGQAPAVVDAAHDSQPRPDVSINGADTVGSEDRDDTARGGSQEGDEEEEAPAAAAAGHGHWPDYDPAATAADDNGADPGEGMGSGDVDMDMMRKRSTRDKREIHPRPHPHPHSHAYAHAHAHRHGKRSSHALRPKGKTYSHPTDPDAKASTSPDDWLKLQQEFALLQRWRRCTRLREGVCPEKTNTKTKNTA